MGLNLEELQVLVQSSHGHDTLRVQCHLSCFAGLDPAEPHFEKTHPMVRLDETDAFYVDVIHTDANPLMSLGLGKTKKCFPKPILTNEGLS